MPLAVALIVAVVFAVVADVWMETATEVFPAGTMAVEGTMAFAELEPKLTVNPPVGAGEVRVKVATLAFPPFTVAGFSEMDFMVGANTVRDPLAELAPKSPVTVVAVLTGTAFVFTENVAVDLPAAIVTEAGVETDPEEDVSATFIDAGAGPDKVIVPVDDVPPTTDAGLNVIVDTIGGLMTMFCEVEPPPQVAEITTLF